MKKQQRNNAWPDKVAYKIAGMVTRLQEKFSAMMDRFSSGLTVKELKMWLLVFCLCWGGLSIYFMTTALTRKGKGVSHYKVDAITTLPLDTSTVELTGTIVDETTYQQIQNFKQSAMYDSTMKVRPGLKDSIQWLEEIYQTQNK